MEPDCREIRAVQRRLGHRRRCQRFSTRWARHSTISWRVPAGRAPGRRRVRHQRPPAGLELFDAASTWRKLAPKLIRSYALDALDRDARHTRRWTGPDPPNQFAGAVASSPASAFPAAGEGEDVRLTGRRSPARRSWHVGGPCTSLHSRNVDRELSFPNYNRPLRCRGREIGVEGSLWGYPFS